MNLTRAFRIKSMSLMIPAAARLHVCTKLVKHPVGHVTEKPVGHRNQTWSSRTTALTKEFGGVVTHVGFHSPFIHPGGDIGRHVSRALLIRLPLGLIRLLLDLLDLLRLPHGSLFGRFFFARSCVYSLWKASSIKESWVLVPVKGKRSVVISAVASKLVNRIPLSQLLLLCKITVPHLLFIVVV